MDNEEEDGLQGGEPFSGPAGPLLEDLRVQMFDQGGFCSRVADDPRAEVIYERIAEWLAEVAEQGPDSPAGCSVSSAASSPSRAAAPPSWTEYVRRTQASVQRRAASLDARGGPRVVRKYHSGGALWHVDLADWQGRHRARLLYDATSLEVSEVRLVGGSGEELRYTSESFGAKGSLLRVHLDRARASCAQLGRSGASKQHQQRARQSVELLFAAALLPGLERLIQREADEGRQLVPPSEDLIEMDVEQIVALLDVA